MRYLAWAAVPAFLFLLFSCDANQTDPVTVKGFTLDKSSSERLTQSVAADASNAASVTFEAASAWTASARETRAVSWLTVVPDHGEAGTATVTFTLDPNDGTESRSAEIVFSCEGGTFTVTITQEGKEETVPPSAYEKHPAVPAGKRMAYATVGDREGNEQEVLVFSYDNDGKLSKVTTFEDVQDGFCGPNDRSEITFTRSEGHTRFGFSWKRRVGAEIEPDEDGMVRIDDKHQAHIDRIAYMYLWQVPIYRDITESYDCEYKGSEMTLTPLTPEEAMDVMDFSYDGDGNFLSIQFKDEDDEDRIIGEWKDGNLVSVKSIYTSYSGSGSGGSTTTEETEQFRITYTDRLNPFTGVSVNVFLFEEIFDWGPLLDDGIIGLQTRNLPARLESTSSYSSSQRTYDFSYTFDDEGRVTSASVGISGTGSSWTRVYRFHYSAQSVPVIGTREDTSEDLDHQEIMEVVYDESTCSHAIVLRSTFGDGHSETERMYPETNYQENFGQFWLYPANPETHPNAGFTLYDLNPLDYERMQPVKVRFAEEKIVEDGGDFGATRKNILYVLDYGSVSVYARFGWYVQSMYDYIAWWDGSAIRYEDCRPYALDPKDAKLEPLERFYWNEKNYSGTGKVTSALLNQPLRLVWPKNGRAVNYYCERLAGMIYVTFAGDGVDD